MNFVTGILAATLICGNTVVACIPLFAVGLIQVSARGLGLRTAASAMGRYMDLVIDYWVGSNRLLFGLLKLSEVNVRWEGKDRLSRKGWYVVVSNHQSWTDILILQTMLFPEMPPIKFFTKQQLIWIPFLGIAMWLLGFPYVRRMSREQIAGNPSLLELDRQATLAACEGFRSHPTTVLNFLEGTRYTPEKHAGQDGRFSALLNPKIGGLALVLTGLENELTSLVDVTITYPDGTPTFWEFVKRECSRIEVLVQCRELPDSVRSAAGVDEKRQAIEPWIEDIWLEKDNRLAGCGQTPEDGTAS